MILQQTQLIAYADNDAQHLTDEGQDLVYEVRIDLLRC